MTALEFATLLHAKQIRRGQWFASCPVHKEKTASLSIRDLGARIAIHCFGCGANGQQVAESIGLGVSCLFPNSLPKMTPVLRQKLRDERELQCWRDSFKLLNSCAIWGGVSLMDYHIGKIDYEIRRNIRRLERKLSDV